MNEDLTNTAQQTGTTQDVPPSEESTVKLWTHRIRDSKEYFLDDFKHMREDMEFAANLQWVGEKLKTEEDRYKANFITHHVNQKVSGLYARDPQATAKRRKRLDYAIWDGEVSTLQNAHLAIAGAAMSGMITPQAIQAHELLQDYEQGKAWEKLCERVGKTLVILYGYQCDTQSPSFKFQMKQLVRRIITTGVGYVRLNFVRNFDHVLSSSLTDDSLAFRIKRASSILADIDADKVDESDPKIEQLKLLFNSVMSSVKQGDTTNIEERIEFDFPSSTSIIVDKKCKTLKGFIGAEWLAQQYIMPLDSANSYFELTGEKKVCVGGTFIEYADDGVGMTRPTTGDQPKDVQKSPLGCFWEVFDLTTKSHFFIADGWKWYVQEPMPLEPTINRFWPVFSLTFNDIEVEAGQKVHIYPPSDVRLLKPMQKEWNRTHQELREHRKANRPFHWTKAGWLTDDDKSKLAEHENNELFELQGSPPTDDMNKSIGHWEGTPLDPNLYATAPLSEDIGMVVGSNQLQQQRPIRHVAATPAVIQEQARISDVNSNVDDLDDLLSEMAQAGGEMMLRTFQMQTVQRIVGKG